MLKVVMEMENIDNSNGLPAVYGTQGGGYVAYCNLQRRYLFVEPPDWDESLKEGDPMPDEWGIAGPVKDENLQVKALSIVQ